MMNSVSVAVFSLFKFVVSRASYVPILLLGFTLQIEQDKVNGEEQKLARIHVRAETSKVRTSRTFLCRNGQYFERLREISKPKSADEFIFTVDNDTETII